MREIKFRAWDKEKKKMEFVGAIDWTENEKIITCNTSTTKHYSFQEGEQEDDFVLMQYTGLKDKNGKEIYEGDIVKMLVDSLNGEENVEVKWRKEGFWQYFNGFDNCEVVGNIYSNPELLKS